MPADLITLSRWMIVLFAAWLIAVSLLMALQPRLALKGLSKMASNNLINYSEITLRLLAGAALAVYAPSSGFPGLFRIAGLFIVATSLILYFVPRTWHAAYAVWWSRKLSPGFVRLVAPISLVAGAPLLCAVV